MSVIIANLISVPILWLFIEFRSIIPLTGLLKDLLISLFGEIFVIIFEAYFIYWLNKKIITLKGSFILSLIMNLVSLIGGGFILYHIFS